MPVQSQNDQAHVRRRRRGFEPASRLVATHLKGPMAKRGFAEAKLLVRWPEIVGADIAAMAKPVSLRHGRGVGLGGTLVLLTTGARAPVLAMRQDEIIARVNACYGYRAVARISITQTAPQGFAEGQAAFAGKPAKEPEPLRLSDDVKARIDQVKDDRLRAALAGLAGRARRRPSPTQH
ncbi:MAG: DUF721 domain-containing protein [Pseudomonadota bacterium]